MKAVSYYTQRLVQIPSPSGQEKELALFIKDLLDDFGLDNVYIDTLGDVIGLVKGKSLHPLVILEGHMDTASPGNPRLWTHDPYSAETVNGRIYGRGTMDMKASIAAMMYATSVISRREHQGTLMLCFVVHEETAEGAAIGHVIENEIAAKPDLVVLGEATNLNLGIGHRGRALVNVELCGRTAHASMPDLGTNALQAAAKLITCVEEELEVALPVDQKLGKATITAISLEASPKGGPQLPDRSTLLFDRRLVRGESEFSILKPIRNKVAELIKRNEASDGTVDILQESLECWTGKRLATKDFFPAWLMKETAIVKKIMKSLHSAGSAAEPYVWNFSTDGVCTYGTYGIPTVGLGPGDETLAHQPNEHVAIADVERAVKMYTSLVENQIS